MGADVRIDFLAQKMRPELRQKIEGGLSLCLLLPIFVGLSWVATGRAWHVFVEGEVEMVSPWALLIILELMTLALVAFLPELATWLPDQIVGF